MALSQHGVAGWFCCFGYIGILAEICNTAVVDIIVALGNLKRSRNGGLNLVIRSCSGSGRIDGWRELDFLVYTIIKIASS